MNNRVGDCPIILNSNFMAYSTSDYMKNWYVDIGDQNGAVCHSYPEIVQGGDNVIKVYMSGVGKTIGVTTGTTYTDDYGYIWYSTWLYDKPSGELIGWFREDYVKLPLQSNTLYSPTINTEDAQNIVDGIVANDCAIFEQLLVMGPAIDRATLLGVDTTNQKIVMKSLIANYTARQEHMNNSTLITIQKKINETEDWIANQVNWNYVSSLPSYTGIDGLGGFWLAFAIGAAVCAGVGYLIYSEFKPDYEAGKVDLKITGEFKKWLDALPKDKQDIIKKDIQKQLDDAYNFGKGGIWDKIKKAAPIVGVVFGGLFLTTLLTKKHSD
jgi:hypothetical protein